MIQSIDKRGTDEQLNKKKRDSETQNEIEKNKKQKIKENQSKSNNKGIFN